MPRSARSFAFAFVVVLGTAVGAHAAPVRPAAPSADANIAAADFCATADEQELVAYINDWRASNGKPALRMSQTVGAAARHHAVDMANQDYFDHTGRDGSSAGDRMEAHGYPYDAFWGETIAGSASGALDAFNQFKNSPGHNDIMLNAAYTTIGVGRGDNANTAIKWWWTVDFADQFDQAAALC